MDGLYTRHQDKQNALSNSTQSYRNSCPGSEILKTRTDHQSNVSATRQEREREQLGREQLRHEQLGRSRTMTPRPREGISRWDIVSGPRRNALDAGQHMRGKSEKDPLALWTGQSAQLRSAETSREVPTNHEAPGQSEALGRGLTGVSLLQELWRDCSPEAEARAARQFNVRRRCTTGPAMHDGRLALALAREWTTSGIATCLVHAQTVATAVEFTVYAVAGATRERPQRKTRWRRRPSPTQCRRANPRAARGGGRSWGSRQCTTRSTWGSVWTKKTRGTARGRANSSTKQRSPLKEQGLTTHEVK